MSYRKTWSKHFGKIPKDEDGISYDIHHIDGNRKNNSIENLQCVSILDHYLIHLQQGNIMACCKILSRMKIDKEIKSKITSGLQTGKKHSEETKRKISEKTRGRVPHNKGIKNPAHSERMRKNNPMKNPNVARKVSLTKTHPNKIIRISKQRNIITYWYFPNQAEIISTNLKDTCSQFGLSYSAVRHKLDKGQYQHGKYKGLEITRVRKNFRYNSTLESL